MNTVKIQPKYLWIHTIALAALIVSSPGYALSPIGQTTYGGTGDQTGTGIAATSTGIYFSGQNGNQGVVGQYTPSLGTTPVWSRNWGGGSDEFSGVAATGNGVYAAGRSYSYTSDTRGDKESKGISVKFNTDGSAGGGIAGAVWSKQTPAAPGGFSYGGHEWLTGVTAAKEGGQNYLYTAGIGERTGFTSNFGTFLSKLDESGNVLWTKNDNTFTNYLNQPAIAATGTNIYMATRSDNSGEHPYLKSYDTNGNLLWAKTSPIIGEYLGVTTANNQIFAVGKAPIGGTNTDFLIESWDSAGNLLWSKTYDRNSTEDILNGAFAYNGHLYAVGSTKGNTAGGTDGIILDIELLTGNLLDTTLWGGARDDFFGDIIIQDNKLYMVGTTKSFGAGDSDIAITSFGLFDPPKFYNPIKTIPVGNSPTRAVMTPNGNEVYVSNYGSNSVSVISTLSNTATQQVSVGDHPDTLAVASDGLHVYVGQHGGNISVINTATKDVTTILSGSPVRDLSISPNGQKLYIAMEFGGLNIAETSSGVVNTLLSTPCPESVVFSPNGQKAYVNYQCAPYPSLGSGHDPIFIFDAINDIYLSAVTTMADGTPIPNVGSALAISPNGSQLWANGGNACVNYSNPGCPIINAGVVNVIRTSDNSVIKTLGFPGGAGLISFSPDNQRVFVGGSSLKIFDPTTFTEITSVPIAASGSLAITKSGKLLYVPVPSENAVRLLEGSVTPPNQKPIAKAGTTQKAKVGDTITLNGADSSDPDGDTLSFAWEFVNKPAVSGAQLIDANTAIPKFQVDLSGNYLAQLTVTDGKGGSASATVLVVAEAGAANRAPIANAGTNQVVSPGSKVQLNGSQSQDPDGDKLTFMWELGSPVGSTARLINFSTATPTFIADKIGIYTAFLSVSDGKLSSKSQVTIEAKDSAPPPPPPTVCPSPPPSCNIVSDGTGSYWYSCGGHRVTQIGNNIFFPKIDLFVTVGCTAIWRHTTNNSVTYYTNDTITGNTGPSKLTQTAAMSANQSISVFSILKGRASWLFINGSQSNLYTQCVKTPIVNSPTPLTNPIYSPKYVLRFTRIPLVGGGRESNLESL